MTRIPAHKTKHQELSERTGSLLKNTVLQVCALPVSLCLQKVQTFQLPEEERFEIYISMQMHVKL